MTLINVLKDNALVSPAMGTGASAAPRLNCLIVLVTSEPHKLRHWTRPMRFAFATQKEGIGL